MNPEMTTPISQLAYLAVAANIGIFAAYAALSPRIRAWAAKRAGSKRRG